MATNPDATHQRVMAHRQRLREKGFRPVQIWIPDTRTNAFLVAAHDQSREVAGSALASTDQAFIDDISQLDLLWNGVRSGPWPAVAMSPANLALR